MRKYQDTFLRVVAVINIAQYCNKVSFMAGNCHHKYYFVLLEICLSNDSLDEIHLIYGDYITQRSLPE